MSLRRLAALIAVAAMPGFVQAEDRNMDNVTILDESLNPLRDHFNAHKDKDRFIAILSPT